MRALRKIVYDVHCGSCAFSDVLGDLPVVLVVLPFAGGVDRLWRASVLARLLRPARHVGGHELALGGAGGPRGQPRRESAMEELVPGGVGRDAPECGRYLGMAFKVSATIRAG